MWVDGRQGTAQVFVIILSLLLGESRELLCHADLSEHYDDV